MVCYSSTFAKCKIAYVDFDLWPFELKKYTASYTFHSKLVHQIWTFHVTPFFIYEPKSYIQTKKDMLTLRPWPLRFQLCKSLTSGILWGNIYYKVWKSHGYPFCRTMLRISTAYAIARCLSVCLSVRHVRVCVKT